MSALYTEDGIDESLLGPASSSLPPFTVFSVGTSFDPFSTVNQVLTAKERPDQRYCDVDGCFNKDARATIAKAKGGA